MTLNNKLITAFLALTLTGCGQSTNEFKRENRSVTVSFDSTYLKKILLTKPESDSIFNMLHNVGEFVSSAYKMNVQPIGWVNDFEFILTPLEEQKLDSILRRYEKETSNELTIITIDESWITKSDFDSLVTVFHNTWGVGKKNKNNGIVIGMSKGLRTIRISNGYGIEAILTDKLTKKIIDEIIIPEFKNEMYYEGLRKGILKISEMVR